MVPLWSFWFSYLEGLIPRIWMRRRGPASFEARLCCQGMLSRDTPQSRVISSRDAFRIFWTSMVSCSILCRSAIEGSLIFQIGGRVWPFDQDLIPHFDLIDIMLDLVYLIIVSCIWCQTANVHGLMVWDWIGWRVDLWDLFCLFEKTKNNQAKHREIYMKNLQEGKITKKEVSYSTMRGWCITWLLTLSFSQRLLVMRLKMMDCHWFSLSKIRLLLLLSIQMNSSLRIYMSQLVS